jgi:hypothetical protein
VLYRYMLSYLLTFEHIYDKLMTITRVHEKGHCERSSLTNRIITVRVIANDCSTMHIILIMSIVLQFAAPMFEKQFSHRRHTRLLLFTIYGHTLEVVNSKLIYTMSFFCWPPR